MVTIFPLAPKYLRAADNAVALGQLLLRVLDLSEKIHGSNLFIEFASLRLGICLLGKLLFPSIY